MSEEKQKRPDARCGIEFLAGVVCFVVSIYVMCKSITFWKEDYVDEFYYSSGLMPMIIGIALFCFSLVYVVRTLKENTLVKCLIDIRNFAIEFVKNKIALKSVVGLLIMWVYIYLMLGKLPFWLATFIALAALLLFMNWTKPMKFRSIAKFTIISIAGTGMIILVFSVIFKVPLP